jgi:F-type H+-transporting ATPase subunit delta
MKKNSTQNYARALYELTKGLSESQSKEVLVEFAKLLIRDHQTHHLDKIITEFLKKQAQEEGSYSATITTAYKIDEQVKKSIQKILGSKIDLQEQIDTTILGGIIIRTDDTILDGSIKTQLVKLKQALVK